ncbi:MAG: 3'-5' exonuclease [Paludibacter sp.]|jgi:ribonuclease D|nr:3'-5' exonuclease [Paludibacter sp.]
MFKSKITKEEVNELPLTGFSGKIYVLETPEEAVKALERLNVEKVVGIDTETKPAFARGQFHKVALLQVSTLDECYLFRLNKMGLPPEIGEFLSNKKIKKIGLALKDDFVGLNRHHRFKPENIVDLQKIVKEYGILELGLQKMYAVVFGEKISKSQRLTNWESPVLSEQQQIYAATDAWAVLKIYQQLKRSRKLTKEELAELLTPEPLINTFVDEKSLS